MNNINVLEKVGFSSEESAVYTTVLQLGYSSITDIAKKTGLKRTSVYNYIESLLKHNLLLKEKRGKRLIYRAGNPEQVLKELEQRRRSFQNDLPQLLNLYKSVRKRPAVEILENKKSIISAYFEVSQSLSPVYVIFSVQDFVDTFSYKEIVQLNNDLSSNNTKIYDMIEDNAVGRKYAKSYRVRKHYIKFLPKKFTFTTDTMVTNDTVLLVSFKNMMGIRIKSEDIADFFRNMYRLVWESV